MTRLRRNVAKVYGIPYIILAVGMLYLSFTVSFLYFLMVPFVSWVYGFSIGVFIACRTSCETAEEYFGMSADDYCYGIFSFD